MRTVFDPYELGDIIKGVVGPPIEELLPTLLRELRSAYPDHIAEDVEWILNNAGGAMGAMALLHGSLNEYLLVFGTPIGTEGHSGRFWADDYFYILDGEQWTYTPGEFRRSVYRPGDMNHMPKGIARGYKIPEYCWAIEYARGPIPTMLPFGLADTMMSTLDFSTLFQTLNVYGRQCFRALSQDLKSRFTNGQPQPMPVPRESANSPTRRRARVV